MYLYEAWSLVTPPIAHAQSLFSLMNLIVICKSLGELPREILPKKLLVIKFRTAMDRSTLTSTRGVLKGTKIYLDDDLTIMQQEHKKADMIKVMEARNASKWAVYRDG